MERTSLLQIDLLLLSLLATVFDQGWSLTCFCQHSRLCQGEEDTCSGQNDVCFTHINGDGTYESACLEVGSNHFTALSAANCLNATRQSRDLLCCNDRDRCNEDLRPSTQQPNSNGRRSTTIAGPIRTDDPNNPLYIGLTVAIIIIALIISAVIIIVGVYYYRRIGRRQQTRHRRHVPTVSSSRNLLMRAET